MARMTVLGSLSLGIFILSACGLKLDDSSPYRQKSTCTPISENFPNSDAWSSELLVSLLQCSQKGEAAPTFVKDELKETAAWLNAAFSSSLRQDLANFLAATPASFSQTLGAFARSVPVAEQKHWPEWIRWTEVMLRSEKIRPELFAEQLIILTKVPTESLEALLQLLETLRAASPEARAQVIERLAKIYTDFAQNPQLQVFLERGVTPLHCLKLEATQSDTSLMSSGWSLLLRTQDSPLTFGRVFAQSYGLLHNFCGPSEIPPPRATQSAIRYFVENHRNIFAPLLKVTDNSSRALIPLLKLWSESQIQFTEAEFFALMDALHQVLALAQHTDPGALRSYVRALAGWAEGLQPNEIKQTLADFRAIPWLHFGVPSAVLQEWSRSAEKRGSSFLKVLADYLGKESHLKMAQLLEAIKVRREPVGAGTKRESSLLAPTTLHSIQTRLTAFTRSRTAESIPGGEALLSCLAKTTARELWACLASAGEPTPFAADFLATENVSPLFFSMSDPEQPGRWLGKGFFGAGALPRWSLALNSLRDLKLPITDFIAQFPMDSLPDDAAIGALYEWLQRAPRTQPEAPEIRKELGIPSRLASNDFAHSVWHKWFADPSYWVPVQKVLSDPVRSPEILRGLQKLTATHLKMRLYRSDRKGLALTSSSSIGMLSALDLLLWEVPYDWTRKWIIEKILDARSPADLHNVLLESRSLLEKGFWLLDKNPLTRFGELWKKASNAKAILDATIALRIEKELFDWCQIMQALSGSLSREDSLVFLLSLQKTGIISSISHFLRESKPSAVRFSATLIEVFHVIRGAKAKTLSWDNAVHENQLSHGLFVYQIFAMAENALQNPAKFHHLRQMHALVKTGSQWVEREKRRLPLSKVFNTITGPDTVLNPWVWIFLREISDPRAKYHAPWMRLLGTLEGPATRAQVENWIGSGIPEHIGSWMDAIILSPSPRF